MSTLVKGITMSKIKEELQRIQDREYEETINFMEWVCDQQQDVGVKNDTKEVGEDIIVSSTTGTSIVSVITLKAVNNIYYEPKQGA